MGGGRLLGLLFSTLAEGHKPGLPRATFLLDFTGPFLWLLGVLQQGSLQAHLARGPPRQRRQLAWHPQECKVAPKGKPVPNSSHSESSPAR